MGGESLYFGKPHPPIYDLARRRLDQIGRSVPEDRILAVGDGIFTDVQGGMGENIDTLFITGGLARDETETGTTGRPDPAKLADFLEGAGLEPSFAISCSAEASGGVLSPLHYARDEGIQPFHPAWPVLMLPGQPASRAPSEARRIPAAGANPPLLVDVMRPAASSFLRCPGMTATPCRAAPPVPRRSPDRGAAAPRPCDVSDRSAPRKAHRVGSCLVIDIGSAPKHVDKKSRKTAEAETLAC
jgi:hypothetical protein